MVASNQSYDCIIDNDDECRYRLDQSIFSCTEAKKLSYKMRLFFKMTHFLRTIHSMMMINRI